MIIFLLSVINPQHLLIMFLRFTHLFFATENIIDSKKIYMEEIAPVIREQQGNLEVSLLEATDGSNEFISSSLWQDEAALHAFEAGAVYQKVISRVKEIIVKPPVQKYYKVNRA